MNPCRDQGIKLPSALSSRQLLVTVQSDWKESLRACTGGATQAVSTMQVNGSETIYLGETLTFENTESFFRELTSRRWDIVRVLLSARKEYDADGVECAGLSQQDIAQRISYSFDIDADIERLTALGLIERDENGRLTCPFAIIRVDVVLQSIM